MQLTKHQTSQGPRWAANGKWLNSGFTLSAALQVAGAQLLAYVSSCQSDESASGAVLAPIDAGQEVWASGVTYLRSRDARMAESGNASIYDKVYVAERPELFMKTIGWRAVGHQAHIRIRKDSTWNVPEPELTLVVNAHGEIVGYTVGNDVSSRDIEGSNALYLPQAKMYNGSAAIGPAIQLAPADAMRALPVHIEIERGGAVCFSGDTSISNMKRNLEELASYTRLELDFPNGFMLMTGTGIVPDESFTLTPGDVVTITLGALTLVNTVG
ncbi:MAG: fumarylacetoacetate hydrolase family protein [Anaerolineae bacterium]|nr:fumarylacetoacetate hydrolase family protein [Anaerolineae bacterium]